MRYVTQSGVGGSLDSRRRKIYLPGCVLETWTERRENARLLWMGIIPVTIAFSVFFAYLYDTKDESNGLIYVEPHYAMQASEI